MMKALVVVGDTLLDRDVHGEVHRLCPDAPVPVVAAGSERTRPGGAGLAATLARQAGDRPVVLVTALGDGAAGREVAALLGQAGVTVVDLGLDGRTPEKLRIRAAGRSLLRLDRDDGPAAPRPPADDAMAEVLAGAGAVLVADYGRGVAGLPAVRAALGARLADLAVVWDPHPRGAEPLAGCRLVTPSAAEAGLAPSASLAEVVHRAAELVHRWEAAGVAVTLGRRGAVLLDRAGTPLVAPPPGPVAEGGDACGAGDCFAASAALALAEGALPSEALQRAVVAAGRFVAAGGAAAVTVGPGTPGRPDRRGVAGRQDRSGAGGGTLVATGGCFDLLHAGHVSTLQAARALGDRLVVLLNSDRSVRRLKGPDRPLQPQADREALLRSLACVDDVIVFDEDTPLAALERLRPDVFVKGGDYTVADLPEATALAAWGGQAVVVPYLPGRSTTRIVLEASRHAR